MFDEFLDTYTVYRKREKQNYKIIGPWYTTFFLVIIIFLVIVIIIQFSNPTIGGVILQGILFVLIMYIDRKTEKILAKYNKDLSKKDKAFILRYLKEKKIESIDQINVVVYNLEKIALKNKREINLLPYTTALITIIVFIGSKDEQILIYLIICIALLSVNPIYKFMFNTLHQYKYEKYMSLATKVHEVFIENYNDFNSK